MPRQSRIDAPGALHHIIARGNEQRKIFTDGKDRERFLERLGEIVTETKSRCYCWSLMPNHFHLFLRTGSTPISTIMRRLLTGYAIGFNRRHRRWGHLFQNRYKSILCQEDPYFLELVRYIHLNPLRSKLVADIRQLDTYPYSGHSVIMGARDNDWQDKETVLNRFGKRIGTARKKYREFVEKGIAQGKRPDLVGGGLIRSLGGWSAVKAMRRAKSYVKGDERILGGSEFVEAVLKKSEDAFKRRYRLMAQGWDIDRVAERVAQVLQMDVDDVWSPGRYQRLVTARSLLCYWAVRELGVSMAFLARRLDISSVAVSKSVARGADLAKENIYTLIDESS